VFALHHEELYVTREACSHRHLLNIMWNFVAAALGGTILAGIGASVYVVLHAAQDRAEWTVFYSHFDYVAGVPGDIQKALDSRTWLRKLLGKAPQGRRADSTCFRAWNINSKDKTSPTVAAPG
jgi:hypothetical protein